MPVQVSEQTRGQTFSRSSNEGQIADSYQRVFRIIKSSPEDVVDAQAECGVYVGNVHPTNGNLYCTSFDVQYESESRMVLEARFNYAATPAGGDSPDPKSQPPDARPALWSVSSSLLEVPVYTWTPVNPTTGTELVAARTPVNAAGDRFDTIGKYEPIVTISIQQFEPDDPTRHVEKVGGINLLEFTIGSLTCAKYTTMLRGISTQPIAEFYNDTLYKGWMVGYEFAYRKNTVKGLWDGAATVDADIGWDIAVPQSGFNVIAFNPAAPGATQDPWGQPLTHNESGKVETVPLSLPSGVTAGDRVRAMVRVAWQGGNGSNQTPSAQPIPLNLDGTPRISTATPAVLVQRYRIYETIPFSQFNIRL